MKTYPIGAMWMCRATTLTAGLLTVIGLLLAAEPAHAATTYTVNSTSDTDDGACSLPRGIGLECTLREAIKVANNTVGKDTIDFKIFGGGVKTIKPNSELPKIAK
jgi:CSLREA domain-containing protein